MRGRGLIASLVLVAPVACGTALLAYVSVAEGTGGLSRTRTTAENSAEAAALGDMAVALHLIRLGDNPTRVQPIRPWIISSSVQRATTLEAAMWSRRIEMIRTLDRQGAIVGADTRHDLACLAHDLDLPEVAEYLAPAGANCIAGKALEAVIARTRGETPRE